MNGSTPLKRNEQLSLKTTDEVKRNLDLIGSDMKSIIGFSPTPSTIAHEILDRGTARILRMLARYKRILGKRGIPRQQESVATRLMNTGGGEQ